MFYYSMLRKEAQTVYDALFCALFYEKTENIAVDLSQLREGELCTVINAIFNDYPGIFSEGRWCCEHLRGFLSFKTPITSAYRSKEVMAFLLKLKEIVQNNCKTEYEKVKYIHDFVINTVKFDHEEIENHTRTDSNHQAVGALLSGKSVCEGIARVTQLLLQICGVRAIFVTGRTYNGGKERSKDAGHAWTVVSVDGQWYHLDVSHDVCLTPKRTQKSYCFFCLTHDQIKKDHQMDYEDEFRKLQCSSTEHNYFYRNKRIFFSEEGLRETLQGALNEAILNKRSSCFFQFKVSDSMQRQYQIPWQKICLSIIYQLCDALEEKHKIGCGFEEPICEEIQGVMAINFNFAY